MREIVNTAAELGERKWLQAALGRAGVIGIAQNERTCRSAAEVGEESEGVLVRDVRFLGEDDAQVLFG